MPSGIGNDAILASFAMPTTNWGQLMAARDTQLQQQAALTQQAQLELTQEQQAAAQVAAFQQRLRSLPLEQPDKQRVYRWILGREKSWADRLENTYEGSLARFMAAEGASWMQNELSALEQSDEYKRGVRNLEHVLNAKEAMKKGESLVGRVVNVNGQNQYVAATKQLQDYYAGISDSFEFGGSYKDDDDLVKHFGGQYGPSKYLKTEVSDAEIQNYLVQNNSEDVARDKYYRRYAGGRTKVFYKVDPLEDKLEFINKQEDQQFQRQDHIAKQRMDNARYAGIEKNNQLKDAKLDALKKDAASANDPGAYLRSMIPRSLPGREILFKPDGAKKLPHSGYDLNSFGGSQGKVNFNELDVLDSQASAALGSLLGAEKTAKGWQGGTIREGIVAANGFNAIDLVGTNHQIVGVEPKIYTNPREIKMNGEATSASGPMGFLKVRVKFSSDDEAQKAGLIDTTWVYDFETKTGVGAYDEETKEVTLYTPIGPIYKNAALNRYLSNQDVGQKETNDVMKAFQKYKPYFLGLDDDD